jgi:hypothetical protein
MTVLPGCSLLQGSTALQDVINDANLILDGLEAAASRVGNLIPSGALSIITDAIAAVKKFLAAAGGATTDSAKPLVQQLISALEAGLPTLLSLVLPPPLGMVINAVITLLPALAQEIGLLTSPQAVRGTMTYNQARAVLKAK